MPSGFVNPITNPQAWDVIYIGQVKSPGFCKVGKFARKYDWDIKKGKGTQGATTTFVQQPPAQGGITFYLWTAAHFVEWTTFRKLLKYDPTKQKIQAVDIYHPSLDDLDIKSVTTEEIGNIIHEGQQMYSIECSFLEFLPAPKKNATGTPTGSKTTQKGTTPGTPPDPIGDAQQREIQALLKKASEP